MVMENEHTLKCRRGDNDDKKQEQHLFLVERGAIGDVNADVVAWNRRDVGGGNGDDPWGGSRWTGN